jgi:hypothetical protein
LESHRKVARFLWGSNREKAGKSRSGFLVEDSRRESLQKPAFAAGKEAKKQKAEEKDTSRPSSMRRSSLSQGRDWRRERPKSVKPIPCPAGKCKTQGDSV